MRKILVTILPFFFLHVTPSLAQKGYALIVGLTHVDNQAYQKKYNRYYDPGATSEVGTDVNRMKEMLSGEDFEVTELRDQHATNIKMLNEIRRIGKKITPHDIFLFYFAGHGDLLADKSNDENPTSRGQYDQVFVTFNDYTLDDSIHFNLKKYFTKNRNVIVVDACHSSSLYKIFLDFSIVSIKLNNKFVRSYAAEKTVELQAEANAECNYDQTVMIKEPYQLIYYGAAADFGSAIGGATGGKLTQTMIKIYREADDTWLSSDYQKFACKIGERLNDGQRLQYHEIGNISNSFKTNVPFRIKPK